MTRFVGTPLRGVGFANAGDEAFSARVLSDSVARVRIDAGGRITWSSGSATGDVNLYRDEANVLKTDDTFKVPALFVDNIEIDTTGAASNQILAFNGTKFVPTTIVTKASYVEFLGQLLDVDISTPTTGQVLSYDGFAWVNSTPSSGSSVTVSDTAPSSPSQGDLWFESDTGSTYVRYDSYWVEIGATGFANAAASSSPPQNPRLGDMWFNSVDGALYVYYDSAWVETGTNDTDSMLSTIAAKGDLVVATSPSSVERLSVGSNGQVLVADSTQLTGLKWQTISLDGAVLRTVIDAKGDLIVGTAADTVGRLGVGTNGQVLTADSAEASGLKWSTMDLSALVPRSIVDAKGDLIVATANDTVARLGVGTNGQILMADSVQTAGVRWADTEDDQIVLATRVFS